MRDPLVHLLALYMVLARGGRAGPIAETELSLADLFARGEKWSVVVSGGATIRLGVDPRV